MSRDVLFNYFFIKTIPKIFRQIQPVFFRLMLKVECRMRILNIMLTYPHIMKEMTRIKHAAIDIPHPI